MKRIKGKDYWEIKDLAEMWGVSPEWIQGKCSMSKEIREHRPKPNLTGGNGGAPLWLKSRLGELNRWKNEYLMAGRRRRTNG